MSFLKKLFYTEVKEEDKKQMSEHPRLITADASPYDEDLSDLNLETTEDLLAAKDLLAGSPDVPLEEDDLGFLDDVAQMDFSDLDASPAGGKIDIDEILRTAGIDVDLERDARQYTMETIWELLERGVTKESLPAIIEVAGQNADDVVQNALQKGAACDKFESDFRQRHQELTKGLSEEISSVELETEEEIQRLKAEMEAKIRELEEQKLAKSEELRQRKQQAIADYDTTIDILDAYEEKCAAVVKALKRAGHGEDVAASESAMTK